MALLEVKNLTVNYGVIRALHGIDFEVNEGEIVALIGSNGAGKTTIFNLLTCIYKPTTGKFWLDGEDLTGKGQETINHKGIARTFQNIRLFNNMTVVRNVMVGLHNQPEFKCGIFASIFRLPIHFKTEKLMRERAKEILRIVDLEDERNNLACNLPYGKQRKLEIARALATNPKLLCLDEPAAGLDPEGRESIFSAIDSYRKKHNSTVVIVSHSMEDMAVYCDKILVMSDSKPYMYGTP